MRRTNFFVASGILSMLVIAAIAPVSFAGGNCMAKLVGSAAVAPGFSCNVKFSNESPQGQCWLFGKGSLSQFFDLFTEPLDASSPDQLSPEYGCACDTTGSFKAPLFDRSADEFECDDDQGGQLQVKVKDKKLSGQGSDDKGNAVIFSCTPNTGCG